MSFRHMESGQFAKLATGVELLRHTAGVTLLKVIASGTMGREICHEVLADDLQIGVLKTPSRMGGPLLVMRLEEVRH